MTDEKKIDIAKSFPDKFASGTLDLTISLREFEIFEKGVFAQDMDSKWHIFVALDSLYLARSWTNFCIYKISFRKDSKVQLKDFQVNRDEKQYRSNDLEDDKISLLKLIQAFLKRGDIYVDPKLKLPLIQDAILAFDKNDVCIKSIGQQAVGLTRSIYENLAKQKEYYSIDGWTEFESNTRHIPLEEELVSLHMSYGQNKPSTTYYFDKSIAKRLGQITIQNKTSSR